MTPLRDINNGKEWDAGEIADLKNSLAYGVTIEEAAEFLCRSGTDRGCAAQGGRARTDIPERPAAAARMN